MTESIAKSISDFSEQLAAISKATRTESEINAVLDELEICRQKATQGESDETDPKWYHVIVEVVLSVLLQNSKQYRNLAKSFFANLCPFIDRISCKTLLAPLTLKDSGELSFTNDDSDADSEGDSDEDDEDDEDDDEDDDNITVNDQLKMAVQKVLVECSGAAENDCETIDVSALNDTDGARLNDLLSETFRSFKRDAKLKQANVKNQQKVEFKVKIFDLLDVYVKWLRARPEILLEIEFCILNLFEETCQFKNKFTEPLRNRCDHILKHFEKKCRSKFETKSIRKHLRKLVHNYRNVKSVAGATAWSNCIAFWANYVNRTDDSKTKNTVRKLIDESFDSFKKKNQLILVNRLIKTELDIKFQLVRKLNLSSTQSLKVLTLLYARLNKTMIDRYQIELNEIERNVCTRLSATKRIDVNRTSIDLFEMLWKKRHDSLAVDWKLVLYWLRNCTPKTSSITKKLAKKLQHFN